MLDEGWYLTLLSHLVRGSIPSILILQGFLLQFYRVKQAMMPLCLIPRSSIGGSFCLTTSALNALNAIAVLLMERRKEEKKGKKKEKKTSHGGKEMAVESVRKLTMFVDKNKINNHK